jgi:hypothetical protein
MTERDKHEYYQSGPYLGRHKEEVKRLYGYPKDEENNGAGSVSLAKLADVDSSYSHIGTCSICSGRVLQSCITYPTNPPQYDPAFCETCGRKQKKPKPPPLPVIEMEP